MLFPCHCHESSTGDHISTLHLKLGRKTWNQSDEEGPQAKVCEQHILMQQYSKEFGTASWILV